MLLKGSKLQKHEKKFKPFREEARIISLLTRKYEPIWHIEVRKEARLKRKKL